jgi:hypothetical protein
MKYQLLSRLKRIYEVTEPRGDDKPQVGFYFEFEGAIHEETHSNLLFMGDGPTGGQHIVDAIPSEAEVIARRVCPCILEWDDRRTFEYASVAVPQLSAFVNDPRAGGYVYRETTYSGEQWARFVQRATDVRQYLERDGLIKKLWAAPNGDQPFQPMFLVNLDDDLRILLKLKFTKARIDA